MANEAQNNTIAGGQYRLPQIQLSSATGGQINVMKGLSSPTSA
jgi:hypothetical protein